jgi:hypothetical protein
MSTAHKKAVGAIHAEIVERIFMELYSRNLLYLAFSFRYLRKENNTKGFVTDDKIRERTPHLAETPIPLS